MRANSSICRMAGEETWMDRAKDKRQKNILCSLRTPGVEDLHPQPFELSLHQMDALARLVIMAGSTYGKEPAMYSTNVGSLTRMGRRLRCSTFVNNDPTLYSLGVGEGYASISIGTPTGDGITKPSHLFRPLKCSVVGCFSLA